METAMRHLINLSSSRDFPWCLIRSHIHFQPWYPCIFSLLTNPSFPFKTSRTETHGTVETTAFPNPAPIFLSRNHSAHCWWFHMFHPEKQQNIGIILKVEKCWEYVEITRSNNRKQFTRVTHPITSWGGCPSNVPRKAAPLRHLGQEIAGVGQRTANAREHIVYTALIQNGHSRNTIRKCYKMYIHLSNK